MVLSVIQILLGVVSIALGSGRGVAVPMLINAIIIYYMYGRNVKEFFRKEMIFPALFLLELNRSHSDILTA